jgi:hypothetical protein
LSRELGLDPLLNLNMRLGDASGAGVAILLMRAVLAMPGWPHSPKPASSARASDGTLSRDLPMINLFSPNV